MAKEEKELVDKKPVKKPRIKKPQKAANTVGIEEKTLDNSHMEQQEESVIDELKTDIASKQKLTSEETKIFDWGSISNSDIYSSEERGKLESCFGNR